MRLDKYLAEHLNMTRSESTKACKNRLVCMNGEVVCDGSVHVKEGASITYQGKMVASNRCDTYLLHKPAGYVSATQDEGQTVLELLPVELRKSLKIVGRLDKDSTGLLLLTRDGALVHKLTSPKHRIPKRYIVHITGVLTKEELCNIEQGVDIGDETKTMPAKLRVIETFDAYALSEIQKKKLPDDLPMTIPASKIEIEITEGRFHQIKRMFHACRHEVFELHRISEGEITLEDDLQVGCYRELNEDELAYLRSI